MPTSLREDFHSFVHLGPFIEKCPGFLVLSGLEQPLDDKLSQSLLDLWEQVISKTY